jgi:NADH-quinone oxidoreductase subunit H
MIIIITIITVILLYLIINILIKKNIYSNIFKNCFYIKKNFNQIFFTFKEYISEILKNLYKHKYQYKLIWIFANTYLTINLFLYLILYIDIGFIKFLTILVPIILSIAFFTLFERKVLAATQRRRGPNVVGIYGLLQAFADGFKLICKETIVPSSSNYIIFIIAPILTFTLSLFSWAVIPFDFNTVIADINLGLLFIFTISSLNIYGIVMSGWASNSKYAFLGAFRSSAQMISYEVSLGLIIMPVLLFTSTTNLSAIILFQNNIFFFIPLWPSLILIFIIILAETNRLPFDLPEAESELVSGFNVEYSSLTFAFFFLAEYSNIILMCTLTVILFLGGWQSSIFFFIPNWISFSFKIVFFMFLFIWVRASLPRYRYDQLMVLGWKIILPLTLAILSLYVGLIILIY